MENAHRTLIIAPTPFFSNRGCHIRIAEQTRALRRIGCDVHIVTYGLGDTPADLADVVSRTVALPWYTKREAGPSWHKIYIDAFLLLHTIRWIWKWQPTVIHAHLHEGIAIAWLARLLSMRWHIPLLFDAQGSVVREIEGHHPNLPQWVFSLLRTAERFLFARATGVITSSDAMTTFVREQHLARDDQHLTTAADSANPYTPLSPEQRAQHRVRLNIPADAQVVVYAGGMTQDKGFDVLYDAMVTVLQHHPDAYFLCVGYPLAEYPKRTRTVGLDARMQFTGGIAFDELPVYLQIADIGIDPKSPHSSQASGKILNYAAAGIPVVAFDSENARKMLPASNGLAPDFSTQSLATAIGTMLNKSMEERQSIGKETLDFLKQHFSWDATARIIRTQYNRMSGSGKH